MTSDVPFEEPPPHLGAKIEGWLKEHLSTPEVSLQEYRSRVTHELGRSVSSKQRIYLDTNVWIWMCDVHLGKARHSAHEEIYRSLKGLVDEGRAICPLSFPIFEELSKQRDPRTRLATAEVMDLFSLAICLLPPFPLARTEFMVYFRSFSEKPHTLPIDELVWTKIAYIAGELVPTNPHVTPEFELAIQKTHVDQMRNMSLVDLLLKLPEFPRSIYWSEEAISRLNADVQKAAKRGMTFNKLYRDEVIGGIDGLTVEFEEALEAMYRDLTGRRDLNLSAGEKQKSGEKFKVLMLNVLIQGKGRRELASLHIKATLHALMRLDSRRKFKVNDMLDIMHAGLALPYCNFVFMEKGFAHLITKPPGKLDQIYDTTVVSAPDVMVDVLRAIG
jgi:hypothetical protein